MSDKTNLMIQLEGMSSAESVTKPFIEKHLLRADGSLNNRRTKALGMTPEELYLVYTNSAPKQCYCGKVTAFSSFTSGYLTYCSTKCMAKAPETKKKIFDTYTGNGVWVEDKDRSDWELYTKAVRTISEANDLDGLENVNLRGKGVDAYHLDHLVSIKYGFDNGIPPSIIGSIHNLRFIPGIDNIRKGIGLAMTSQSLYNLYYSHERVVIDTNVFIDEPNVCENLLKKGVLPIIPYTVLSELDNLKRNPDLKRAAQLAIKSIRFSITDVAVTNVPTTGNTNDEYRRPSCCLS